MSATSDQRSREFLEIAPQFQLGMLVTESSHPVTANLSEVVAENTEHGLRLLFEVDLDVQRVLEEFVASGRAVGMASEVADRVRSGGRVFFTGCGSTGRLSILLDAMWRGFWRSQDRSDYADRSFSVMAGGDFALIKSVEGFEDFTQFGRKQIRDLGVGAGDVVFAITEGGETSFVIGTAWEGLDSGAKVFFVYNNPDEALRPTVQRSREVIDEPRIEKLNLTTGPMGISGSTRMQATTIELLCVGLVLEMAVRDLMGIDPSEAPQLLVQEFDQVVRGLLSEGLCRDLAELVDDEARAYRAGLKTNYFADDYGIDLLTDTTERSPTYCVPPFRKFDDLSAAPSWAYLYVPQPDSQGAWSHILQREPRCVEWDEPTVRALVTEDKAARTLDIVSRISTAELMRFRIGSDGLSGRPLSEGDCAVALVAPGEGPMLQGHGFYSVQLAEAVSQGAHAWAILVGDRPEAPANVRSVCFDAPSSKLMLRLSVRAGVKMLLNALSTCTMVRLGRVMGNTMVYVVPSNLKLIDRSTRYIARLTGLEYEAACRLLHEVIEYVQPRMLADKAYPPVVAMSVLRHRLGLTNEQAEEKLAQA